MYHVIGEAKLNPGRYFDENSETKIVNLIPGQRYVIKKPNSANALLQCSKGKNEERGVQLSHMPSGNTQWYDKKERLLWGDSLQDSSPYERHVDEASGRSYWFNKETSEVSWKRPTLELAKDVEIVSYLNSCIEIVSRCTF